MVVRCTAKLLKLLGVPRGSRETVEPSADDWYVNLLWFDRPKCLLGVHAATIFAVFVADVRRRDLEQLGMRRAPPVLARAIVRLIVGVRARCAAPLRPCASADTGVDVEHDDAAGVRHDDHRPVRRALWGGRPRMQRVGSRGQVECGVAGIGTGCAVRSEVSCVIEHVESDRDGLGGAGRVRRHLFDWALWRGKRPHHQPTRRGTRRLAAAARGKRKEDGDCSEVAAA
jgi:hypothetical protein